MIIYRDILSGDEMFSDAFKITVSQCGFLYEVEGKTVTRTDGFDESSISSNPSADEVSEASETTSVMGVDIILNHRLQKTSFTKKQYMTYIKGYMKMLKVKLEETNPARVEDFMAGAGALVKKITANLDNYDFYTGENMNPEGMVGLLDYREDGTTPYMLFMKDGLEIEKF
uniref:Translationally-controlled tumor protein homolog n=1 Tax=Monopterus albus TaxID=43700 RepID=A0A3Q3Q7P4_MONAL|nr:translationally-controlled tumor protein [Monopterus albus]